MEPTRSLRTILALSLGLFLLPLGGLAQSDRSNDKEDVKKEEGAKEKASPSRTHPVELEDAAPKLEIKKVEEIKAPERLQLKPGSSGKRQEAQKEDGKKVKKKNEEAVEPRPSKERKRVKKTNDE